MKPNLYGIPIIRDGDNVYLIGNLPDYSAINSMKDSMERMSLSMESYRCPFDFLNDFDQWFEWQRRLYVDNQTTGKIITNMISDIQRIKEHQLPRQIKFNSGFCREIRVVEGLPYTVLGNL